MPSFPAQDWASGVRQQLHNYPGLQHLRVRHRGDTLILESGPENDAFAHARLRRLSATLWTIEMPSRSGRWDPTGLRGTVDNVVVALTEQFGWTLEPIHGYP